MKEMREESLGRSCLTCDRDNGDMLIKREVDDQL